MLRPCHFACLVMTVIGLVQCQSEVVVKAVEPKIGQPARFRDLLIARQKDLLQEATRYAEQNPEANDLDEVFSWSFETARRFGLEAEATPLAERCLKSRTVAANAKPFAKQIVCVGLAKSGRLEEAISAFQDSLQFARLGAGAEQLDLAVELVAQAGLAGEHKQAKSIFETVSNRFGLNQQVGDFCENRLKKLELVGSEAPELGLTELSGQPVSIAASKGKVLLIDFWATNCPPCLAEFPKLKQLYAEKHEEGFDVIGISLDDSKDVVDAFQVRAQLPWKLVCEVEQVQAAREKYRVRTIPSLFLVGRDGRIAQVDLKGSDLRLAVERCLGQKTP